MRLTGAATFMRNDAAGMSLGTSGEVYTICILATINFCISGLPHLWQFPCKAETEVVARSD